jgi:phosphoribosylformylglycinamidine (FGAM) synthase-like enzyme
VITAGIEHRRPDRPRRAVPDAPATPGISDHDAFFRELIARPNLSSREPILRFYDTEVQGRIVIRAGEADATVLAPVRGAPLGCAVTVDGNPWLVEVDPYRGAAHAVCEVCRNLAAVGAEPVALTDCLNAGNPEDPEVFRDFIDTVKGLGDAARALGPEGPAGPPVPYVSGNVSFYNEGASGRPIEPSPIVAGLGVLPDYSVAVTVGLKRTGSVLLLSGPREERLGASQYRHARTGRTDGPIPSLDLEAERRRIYATMEAVRRGLVLACHDISEGGLAVAAFEMARGGLSRGIGLQVPISGLGAGLSQEARLYGESPGFLYEVAKERLPEFLALFQTRGVDVTMTGRTLDEPRLRLLDGGRTLIDAPVADLAAAHGGALGPLVE